MHGPRALSLIWCCLLMAPLAHAQIPADLRLTGVVTSGLSNPLFVTDPGDGSGRLFVVEQGGVIKIIRGGALVSTPFLDISGIIDDTESEQGLLGLAFHPDFATNGYFYVNYTRDPGPGLDRTVVRRYEVSAGDPDVADASSGFTLLEVAQDFDNHNGGHLAFGPDGFLYIAMGDGGMGGDPLNRAQNKGQLLGKILRIDVDGTAPVNPDCGLVGNYKIPANNPFVGVSGCDEIWTLGLRNPWRFSFDRRNGDMYIGDVGQGTQEEISFQPGTSSGGENFGWRCKEGTNDFNNDPDECTDTFTDPILVYGHAGGRCSVTGGYVYTGQMLGMVGQYIYGDFCTGEIFFASQNEGGDWTDFEWDDTTLRISSFGQDAQGEVYVVDRRGGVYIFSSPSHIFGSGFEFFGLDDWSSSVP